MKEIHLPRGKSEVERKEQSKKALEAWPDLLQGRIQVAGKVVEVKESRGKKIAKIEAGKPRKVGSVYWHADVWIDAGEWKPGERVTIVGKVLTLGMQDKSKEGAYLGTVRMTGALESARKIYLVEEKKLEAGLTEKPESE